MFHLIPNALYNYEELLKDWPASSLKEMTRGDGYALKSVLSPTQNGQKFYDFCQSTAWHKLARYVRGFGMFEFSWIPANGGFLTPHFDNPNKTLSMVLPFGEWNVEWGGVTQFHDENNKVIATAPFVENQGIVFEGRKIKHSVQKCNGPAGMFRKSLTIHFTDRGVRTDKYGNKLKDIIYG